MHGKDCIDKKMKKAGWGYKLLFLFYCIVSVVLFLYSYTQVDLNLTLSRMSAWQTIQKSFQYVGYFQRPLSTGLYLGILASLFLLYITALRMIRRGTISESQLWKIVLGVSGILVLSYPAFSADMFNYMFTAKTVLVYHKNPYVVLPIQFSGVEPWIMFMRWIHLPSAYTPIWIALTLVPYLLGFGYFLLIMWNMKLLVAGFYFATIWGVGKILERVEGKNKTLGMAILGLNPLIIIESLVSAHNDIAMMALAVFAMYFFILHKRFSAWVLLALSAAMKLITVFLVPVFFLGFRRTVALAAITVGLIMVLLQPNREFLPWYFVWIVPFVALLPNKPILTVTASGFSLGLLLRYAPYLYLGHWNAPVPEIKWWVTVTTPLLFSAGYSLYSVFRKATLRRGKTG